MHLRKSAIILESLSYLLLILATLLNNHNIVIFFTCLALALIDQELYAGVTGILKWPIEN